MGVDVLRPDSPELADAASAWRSAYLHVPFCRRRCPYCDFAVVAEDEIIGDAADAMERYVDAVLAEIEMEPPWDRLDAVNVGGGTPSALPARHLGRLLEALSHRFGISPAAEVSIEVNPEDVTSEFATELAVLGFNRASVGVQSFDAAILGVLGRRHRPDDGRRSVDILRNAGIHSVSLDLIFGAAGENLTSWAATVAAAVDAAPDHLSAYGLTVEPGTQLWLDVRAGSPAPDPDHQADEYLALESSLAATDLIRYEVSNWARPGHHCRYNLSTWGQGEYVAFGLGAHGHRAGVRRRNVRRLDTYLARIVAGERPETAADTQDAFSAEQERLMLGLRRSAGVAAGELGRTLLGTPEGKRMVDAGIVALEGDRLVVRKPLLTDTVVRSVLSLSPGEC